MITPAPFWAVILILMGCLTGMVAYVAPGSESARTALFNIALAVVSGGLGAFAGHAAGEKPAQPKNGDGGAE